MAKTCVLHCTDWDIDRDGNVLRLRPSGRTNTARLGATLLAGVFLVLLVSTFGFPPGSRAVSRQAARVARLERQARQVEDLRDRTARIDSRFREAQLQNLEGQLAAARGSLESERARLATMRANPTLGRAGDTAYWIVFGTLLVIGVGAPLSGRWERITLDATEPGRLSVRRRGQVLRSRTYDLRDFRAMGTLVRRDIASYRRHTEDRGWCWHVLLIGEGDPGGSGGSSGGGYSGGGSGGEGVPLVDLRIDQEDTLPVRVEELTPRVRAAVAFLGGVTGLPPAPPQQIDVLDVRRGLLSTKWRFAHRQHGPGRPRRGDAEEG